MTDKQIIIDGVDVGECGYYVSTGECTNENVYPDYCRVCSNCRYKLEQKLKAKEQECEELKGICKGLDITTDNCINLIELRNQQLDQLEAELHRADCRIADDEILQCDMRETIEEVKAENETLKQTLTEIKEVLQFYNNLTIGINKGNGIFETEVHKGNFSKFIYYYDTNPAKQALQKISEVIDE